jgi:type I restriction enzyme S subunit
MTGRYQTYPEYKESGSKWLDEVPSGWKVTALKHVLVTPITDGPHSTPTFLDEGIPFVSAEAVSGGYINFNKIRGYISEEDDVFFSQKYRPQRNDVYMIKSGATTGITAIVETDKRFNIWSPLAVMRCKDRYNSYFLLNYLRSDTFQNSVQLSWTFGTQQNIGMNILENLTVCYPPFEEQQKIANFLDHETAKIDTLIAKQEKLIELLKEKRQAVISHAVTRGLNPDAPMKDSGVEWLGKVPEHWTICEIKFVLTSLDFRRIPLSGEERSHRSGEFRYYGASGVIDHINDYIFDEPTVLVGEDGANLISRRTPLAFAAHGKYWVNNHAHILKPKDGLADYWAEVIENINIEPLISGSAQPKFTAEALNNLKIAFPESVEERLSIENHIKDQKEKFDLLMFKANSSISLIKERKTALISAAVTGKIDVRNWQSNA